MANNTIEFTIRGVDKFTSTFGKLNKSLVNTTKNVAKVGAVAAAAMAAIAVPVLKTAKAFEKMEASLKTVTGSAHAAALAMDDIKTFAKETPFQVDEITNSFIKLKALGLDPSEEALRSYGNTASAMGKSLDQMIEAVADATTNEFERLKEFGIKAKQEGDRVSFTFQGVTTTVAKNSTDINNFLIGIGKTNFAGAMSEQMSTLDGMLSNLSDTVDNFFDTIGKAGGLDLAKRGVQSLTEFVGDLEKAFFRVAAVTSIVSDNISKRFKASMGSGTLWQDFIDNAVKANTVVFDIVVTTFSNLIPIVGNLFKIIWDTFIALDKWALLQVADLFLFGFSRMTESVKKMFVDFWESTVQVAKEAWTSITNFFTNGPSVSDLLFKDIPAAASSAVNSIQDALGSIEEQASVPLLDVLKFELPQATEEARISLAESFSKMGTDLSEGIGAGVESLASNLGVTEELVNEKLASMTEGFGEFADFANGRIEESVEQVGLFWETMSEQFQTIQEKQQDLALESATLIFKTTQALIDGTSKAIAETIVEGKSLSKTMKAVFKSVLKDVIAGFIKMGIQRLITGQIFKTVNISTAKSEVAAASGRAFANAFASTAAIPIVGPALAPGVAAASASAAAAGGAAGIAAASVPLREGLDQVPRHGLIAELHKDEAVLDARQARDFRQFGLGNEGEGGAGTTIEIDNFNVSILPNATTIDSLLQMSDEQISELVESRLIPAFSDLAERGIRQIDTEREL